MNEEQNLPPLPWWQGREARRAARAERRRERHEARDARGRNAPPAREPVTPDRIADAALAVIDAEGLDGLTVRRLAQELGVGTMTLYWYVQNKGEVLDLVADRLLAGVAIPPGDTDWQSAVREVCIAVRAALLSHASAVPIMVGRGSFGPNGLRLIEASILTFRGAGFDDTDAADAYFTVSNFVTGFCTFETAGVSVAGGTELDRRDYGRLIRSYIESLPPDRFPNLLAAAPRIFSATLDERFRFGVDCIVDGLARRLEEKRVAPAS